MKIEKVSSPNHPKPVWKFDVTIGGVRFRHSGFATKQECSDAVAALRLKARSLRYGYVVAPSAVTLGQLLALAEADKRYAGQRYVLAFRQFCDLLGHYLPLIELRKAHGAEYVRSLEARGMGPGGVRTYVGLVVSVLNSASTRFAELDEWKAPQMPRPAKPDGRTRILSPEELSALFTALAAPRLDGESDVLRALRPSVLDVCRLVLLFVCRESEVLELEPARRNERWRTMTIWQSKVSREKVVPLGELAEEILTRRAAAAATGKGYFPGLRCAHLYKTLRRAAVAADVLYGDKVEGGFVLHDLRHTAASVIDHAGLGGATVREMLGHRPKTQSEEYTHATLATKRAAVAALENFCRQIDGFCRESSQPQAITAEAR